MNRREISIPTPDGACRAMLCVPDEGAGPWPGVILYMDAPGYRPEFWALAEGLADQGYVALAPDLFYRQGPYPPWNATQLFADPDVRAAWLKTRMGALSPEMALRDTQAFLDFLSAREDVKPVFGVAGYCMGGALALRAAAAHPDQIKACASYHGGNLATDDPQSAHLTAHRIKAEVLIAAASEDPIFPEAQRQATEAALKQSGCVYAIETFAARHGFTFSDHPAYDQAASQRQWDTMKALFARALK